MVWKRHDPLGGSSHLIQELGPQTGSLPLVPVHRRKELCSSRPEELDLLHSPMLEPRSRFGKDL